MRETLPGSIRKQFEQLYKLPAIPEIGHRILALQSQPEADFDELINLIESDPALAAVILRFSRSSLYHYQGDIDSVEKAVTRVLGFDTVINIAIAISIGNTLKMDRHGALGLDNFWKHSVFCAGLAQQLSKLAVIDNCLPSGHIYLAGLLHNIGLLALGHMFKPEFAMLNKLATANPNVALTKLEAHLLCMGTAKEIIELGHERIGHYLMESWNMPDFVMIAAREHHNFEYDDEYNEVIHLIQLANVLLSQEGIGDEVSDFDLDYLTRNLHINMEDAIHVKDRLLIDLSDDLKCIANEMAA